MIKLRDEFKLFTKTAATTNRNQLVSNVFVYKKKDALKSCLVQYEEMRKLLTVFDIKELPYISDKIERKVEE